MKTTIFVITLLAEILTTLTLVFSIAFPRGRIWPPGREHGWGRTLLLTLFLVSGAGVVSLGILDWGRLGIAAWVRVGAGGPLWLGGNLLAVRAAVTLGLAATTGGGKALTREGAYRFSRNPQYVGFILALAGWGLLTASGPGLIACLAGILPLLLVPFAEEPWLEERYGPAYKEYKRTVPRFFSFRRKKESQPT